MKPDIKSTFRPAVSVGHYPASDVAQTIAVARELDGGLIDTLWLGDSPVIWRECWTSLTLCLATTETLRLGTAVTNPLSRDWTATASALQTLNEYAPGRVRLGIGVGDSALRRVSGRVARLAELEEAVTKIRALATTGTATEPDATIQWERPTYSPEILLSGSGPKTLALAGAIGDGAIVVPGVSRPAVAQVLEAVYQGARERGRAPESLHNIVWVACSINSNEDKAWGSVRPWVASVIRHPLVFKVSQEVAHAQASIRTNYDFAQHMSSAGSHGGALSREVLRDFAVAGSQEDLSASLRNLLELPVDEVALVLMGDDQRRQSSALREVVDEVFRS